MANKNWSDPRVVLIGLDGSRADELRQVLREQGYAVHSRPLPRFSQALSLVEEVKADLVFCSAEPEQCAPLLQAMKQERTDVPVVAVSRLPEVSLWLNALELGAADYCAPPFESIQIQWILESALKSAA